ncbi:MAG: iron-dependent repressor [Flaviaesturariibacter sp.]|nr:iron-dependent repressor [Flaviaesturariibacter sp.]
MVNYSSSEENYLKAIYHLQTETGKVTTNALAEELHSRPASITDMMKKLSTKGLLDYKPYYGFSLSAEGKKAALLIIRRHRLWEFFLAEKLGFGWDEVHLVAEELEHVSSKMLIDKLDEYLGFPQFDPHGDPIPNSKGKITTTNKLTLAELPLHQPAKVIRVANKSIEMLELLEEKGIAIGSVIQVQKQFGFDHSLQIKIKPTTIETVSEQLAKNIFVQL